MNLVIIPVEHIDPDCSGKTKIKSAKQDDHSNNCNENQQWGNIKKIPQYQHYCNHFSSSKSVTYKHGAEEETCFFFKFITTRTTPFIHSGHFEQKDIPF